MPGGAVEALEGQEAGHVTEHYHDYYQDSCDEFDKYYRDYEYINDDNVSGTISRP